jgi:hypothetical protein
VSLRLLYLHAHFFPAGHETAGAEVEEVLLRHTPFPAQKIPLTFPLLLLTPTLSPAGGEEKVRGERGR